MTGALSLPLDDGAILLHRYDEAADSFHFVRLDREARREATFLSDEYLPDALAPIVVARTDIADAGAARAPLHYIFHSGFCCSTLLTRALDQPGMSSALSEPTVLRDMSGYRQRANDDDHVRIVLDQTLDLLARPFETGEAVVAKPSCTVNGLADTLLAMRADSHAVFLYAPLRLFLNSIARKGITGRLWGRELFITLQKTAHIDLGFDEEQLFGQTDLQIAGLAWLAQNRIYESLLANYGADRVASLDSETFLAHRVESLARIGRLFGLDMDTARAQAIANSAVFQRHSKFGDDFDASDRQEEQAAGESAHADEIEKVAIWVETVAEGLNIPIRPSGNIMD